MGSNAGGARQRRQTPEVALGLTTHESSQAKALGHPKESDVSDCADTRLSTLENAYLHQLAIDGAGQSDLNACKRTLREFKTGLQDPPIAAILRNDAHHHISNLRGTVRVSTVRTRAKILSGSFNWVRYERDLIQTNVF